MLYRICVHIHVLDRAEHLSFTHTTHYAQACDSSWVVWMPYRVVDFCISKFILNFAVHCAYFSVCSSDYHISSPKICIRFVAVVSRMREERQRRKKIPCTNLYIRLVCVAWRKFISEYLHGIVSRSNFISVSFKLKQHILLPCEVRSVGEFNITVTWSYYVTCSPFILKLIDVNCLLLLLFLKIRSTL